MRKCNSDCARAGSHVDDARISLAVEALQYCFDQMFRFRTRDQNSGRDFEEKAKKFLRAGEVLHRFTSQAAAEQGSRTDLLRPARACARDE